MRRHRRLDDSGGLFGSLPPVYVDPTDTPTEAGLAALAIALGAEDVAGWSPAEEKLARALPRVNSKLVSEVRDRILAGGDPLGDLFCSLRRPEERRKSGAVYTPPAIVDAMAAWAHQHCEATARVVDPGAGSGRYILAAGHRFRNAALVGIEVDALAALMARANLAVWGMEGRSRIVLSDYRTARLEPIDRPTLFIGNPPYIRHHLLEPSWKQWLITEANRLGLSASQLAGLHVHFFLATALKAAPGDYGAFITAAEWLDVNYGSLVRELFLGPLGGRRIVVIEPTAAPFPDAATTAAITYFDVGSKARSIRLKRVSRVEELQEPNGNRIVRRERLEAESRWSHFTRTAREIPKGYVELGELCRVHRGQVTGANRVWIAGEHSEGLPASVLFATVTKARELFRAGRLLEDPSVLRRVIDLPVDLDVLDAADRKAVGRFLRKARAMKAHEGYVASTRKAWWSVGLREPAPILASYMARRPPAFVQNVAMARHINIAHGLYPREAMDDRAKRALVNYLSDWTHIADGRTYAGGLTKFEPREMERLLVPEPGNLYRLYA